MLAKEFVFFVCFKLNLQSVLYIYKGYNYIVFLTVNDCSVLCYEGCNMFCVLKGCKVFHVMKVETESVLCFNSCKVCVCSKAANECFK